MYKAKNSLVRQIKVLRVCDMNKGIVFLTLVILITGCSGGSSSDTQAISSVGDNTDTSVADCDSVDISVFCVSINGAEKTIYVHTEDSDSPLSANPFLTSRFDTSSGITLAEVRFDILPTSFIKALSIVFSGNAPGIYTMDGSGNFSVYTLAADQSWSFISGFSSGSIEITHYGDVGDFIRGTYTANLCDLQNAITIGSDCSDTTYQIDISGNFNIKRDGDV